MTRFNAPPYDIERPTGQCAFTGRVLEPGETYVATLVEIDERTIVPENSAAARLGMKRLDISGVVWDEGRRPDGLFGHWKTTVTPPDQKKKLFVDDDVLMNLFHRLADTDQPQRIAFRFVLALVLMRKKLLKYEGSRCGETDEHEWWQMVPKGQEDPVSVENPNLDEGQIQQVTEQLGEILEAEF